MLPKKCVKISKKSFQKGVSFSRDYPVAENGGNNYEYASNIYDYSSNNYKEYCKNYDYRPEKDNYRVE